MLSEGNKREGIADSYPFFLYKVLAFVFCFPIIYKSKIYFRENYFIMKKNLISLLGRLSVLVGLSSCTTKNPSMSGSVSSGLSQSEATTLFSKYCETHPAYKGTEDEWLTALFDGSLAQSYKTSYNNIFTIATIPPVLSALDSIRNGNETYAFIER